MRTTVITILALFILMDVSFTQGPPCSPGNYDDMGTCQPCIEGTVQPNSGQTECIQCAGGTFQALTGREFCEACPVGRYQPNEGAANCIECELGRFQDQTGQLLCKVCPAGTYGDVNGATSCKPCGAGETSPQGSISASACVANTTANGGPASIPTLTEWALIILFLILAIAAILSFANSKNRSNLESKC